MLEEQILQLYRKLRLLGYHKVFGTIHEKSGSLSATEAFSADVIHLLGAPTLSQFASFLGISQPNATYKVNSLVSKGYVKKTVPEADQREVRLQTCGKYDSYFEEQSERVTRAIASLGEDYTSEQLQTAAEVLAALVERIDVREEKTDGHL